MGAWSSLLRASFSPETDLFHGTPTLSGSGYVLSKGLMDATFGQHRDHMMNAFGGRLPGMCCGEEWLARSMFSLPNVMVKAPYGGSTAYFSGETPLSQRYDASNWCEPIMTL